MKEQAISSSKRQDQSIINIRAIVLIMILILALIILLTTVCSSILDSHLLAAADKLQPEVFIQLPRPIKPFDDTTLLPPRHPDAKPFPPIGYVHTIGSILSRPRFFSSSFTISTRESNVTNILLKPKLHRLRLLGQPENEHLFAKYEFNLTKLAPPLNKFRADKRTIVVIPGYLSGKSPRWLQDICDKWLRLEDVNVIQVDWSDGNEGLYDTAVANVKLVARQVVILLYYLSQLHGLDFASLEFRDSIHLVGHSLGAHVAGFVGQELGGQVSRITGLDPAGVIFDKQPNEHRLDRTDAELVDALHTNAGHMHYVSAGIGLVNNAATGLLKRLPVAGSVVESCSATVGGGNKCGPWFGIEGQVGHLDYYANGGSVQPGCNDQLHLCDHSRAIDIYLGALDYEIRARSKFEANISGTNHFRHRLVAFKSPVSKLASTCPNLISTGSSMGNQSACAVPMDFVSRGGILRRELEQVYGFRFPKPDCGANQDKRLYFWTHSSAPFVGELHLLKLHMQKPLSSYTADNWAPGCNLVASVKLAATNKTKLKFQQNITLNPVLLEPTSANHFYGLASPILLPYNWLKVNDRVTGNANDTKLIDEMNHLAPTSVTISLQYTGNVLHRAVDSMVKIMNRALPIPCKMAFEAAELRSLMPENLGSNTTSWYFARSANQVNQILDNETTDKNEPLDNKRHARNAILDTNQIDERKSFLLNATKTSVTLKLASFSSG